MSNNQLELNLPQTELLICISPSYLLSLFLWWYHHWTHWFRLQFEHSPWFRPLAIPQFQALHANYWAGRKSEWPDLHYRNGGGHIYLEEGAELHQRLFRTVFTTESSQTWTTGHLAEPFNRGLLILLGKGEARLSWEHGGHESCSALSHHPVQDLAEKMGLSSAWIYTQQSIARVELWEVFETGTCSKWKCCVYSWNQWRTAYLTVTIYGQSYWSTSCWRGLSGGCRC